MRPADQAKAAGRLRADFVPENLVLILMANAGVISATGDHAPNAWRRIVGYLIQALSAEHAQPLPAPPRPSKLHRAMLRLAGPDKT